MKKTKVLYKKRLAIIGAGGHGKVVADVAMKMGRWETVVFVDDDERIAASMGIRVIGKLSEMLTRIDEYDLFVGIGDNQTRKTVQEKIESAGASVPVLIHPDAVVGSQVDIAPGTVVMAGTVINCCTKVGKGCIVNTGSTIDHDDVIGSFVHLSPGTHLAGNVTIEQGSWLGIGSIVSHGVHIIEDCTVGAGSVVLYDICETGTYVGVPARKI